MRDIREFGPIWESWEILEKLGEGAYGTVWKACHKELDQVYFSAVKHISIPRSESEIPALLEEGIITNESSAQSYYHSLLQNLQEEIDVMYRLRGHTHIVSYEDHRVIPKKTGIGYDIFIRMELLDSVSSRLREGTFRSDDVIRLGKDIANAISLLNQLSIVHRDIKPQNIFINKTGNFKLGDYGTARILERTNTAMSKKGTYSYMAPEVYRGGEANGTVDIYSLGIVMYRMMNGNQQPFLSPNDIITPDKTETALMRRISGQPLPPPAYANPDFAKVILKACAFHPEDRYQSGDELRKALDQLEKGQDSPDDSISLFPELTNPSSNEQGSAVQAEKLANSPEPGNSTSVSEAEKEKPILRKQSVPPDKSHQKHASIAWLIGVILLALVGLLLFRQKILPIPVIRTDYLPVQSDADVSETPLVSQSPTVSASSIPSVTPSPVPEPTEEPSVFSVDGHPAAGDTLLSGAGIPGMEISIRRKSVLSGWGDNTDTLVGSDGRWAVDFSDQPLEGQEMLNIVYWITETKPGYKTIIVDGDAPTEAPASAKISDMAPVSPFYVPSLRAEFLRTIPDLYILETAISCGLGSEVTIQPLHEEVEIHVYDHDLELETQRDGNTYTLSLGDHRLTDLTVSVSVPGGKLSRQYSNFNTNGAYTVHTGIYDFEHTCILPGTDYLFYQSSEENGMHNYYFSSGDGHSFIRLLYAWDDLGYVQTVYFPTVYSHDVYYSFTTGFEDNETVHYRLFVQFDEKWHWDDKNQIWANEDNTKTREDLAIRGDDPDYNYFLLSSSPEGWEEALPTPLIEGEPIIQSAKNTTMPSISTEFEELTEDTDPSHYSCTTTDEGLIITSYSGSHTSLIFPSALHDIPVIQIGDGKAVSISLKQAVIPEGVLALGERSFCESNLEEITLPESLCELGNHAFSDSKLKSVTIPAGVTRIGEYCFYKCSYLETASLSEGLREIGKSAFVLCSQLKSIHIPASVSTMASGSFASYDGKLVVDTKNPYLEQKGSCIIEKRTGTLLYCKVESGVANIAEGVRIIGDYTFCAMTVQNGPSYIHFPDTLEEIGECAFMYCFNLAELTVPGHVKIIRDSAFWNCNKLQEIIVEEGVEEIEAFVFGICSALNRIVLPSSLKLISDDMCTGYDKTPDTIIIAAPAGSVAAAYAQEHGFIFEDYSQSSKPQLTPTAGNGTEHD